MMAMLNDESYDKFYLGEDARCIVPLNCKKTKLNNNVLVEGGTGTGKSLSILVSYLLHVRHTNSIVIVTKKSLMNQTIPTLKAHGYDVTVMDFVNPGSNASGFDPLQCCKTRADVEHLAYTIIHADPVASQPKDLFWDNSAQQIIELVLRFVWEGHFPQGDRLIDAVELLDHVYKMECGSTEFDEPDKGDRYFRGGRFDDGWDEDDKVAYPLQYALRNLKHINRKDYGTWKAFNKGADQTSASIASTVNEQMSKIFNEDTRAILRNAKPFDFKQMLQPHQVLFIYMSPVNVAQHRFISLFYQQAFKSLFELGESQPDGVLPYPIQVVCDDFATGCHIPDFDQTISIFREKGMAVTMLLQSETQLAEMYGELQAQTIINNCDTIVYLGGMDLKTCESVARRANVPLEDVVNMHIGNEIFFRRGMKPVFTKRYDTPNDPLYIQSREKVR